MTETPCALCLILEGALRHPHATSTQHVFTAAVYMLSECEDDGVATVLAGLCAECRKHYDGAVASYRAEQSRSAS